MDRIRNLLARRVWGAFSVASTIFGIGSWPQNNHVWFGWLDQLHPVVAGVFIGAGGLGFVLFAIARWSTHFRRLWLSDFGARVRFAVVEANHCDTPPVEWSTARVRCGKKRVLEFDGFDLPEGYLTMIVPLDCTVRFRGSWDHSTTLSGHTYRTAAKFDGWPLSVDLWMTADPIGGVHRREKHDKLKRDLKAIGAIE